MSFLSSSTSFEINNIVSCTVWCAWLRHEVMLPQASLVCLQPLLLENVQLCCIVSLKKLVFPTHAYPHKVLTRIPISNLEVVHCTIQSGFFFSKLCTYTKMYILALQVQNTYCAQRGSGDVHMSVFKNEALTEL